VREIRLDLPQSLALLFGAFVFCHVELRTDDFSKLPADAEDWMT